MQSIQQWLDDYSSSHRNPTNKAIHWSCIPPIVLSAVGLLLVAPVGSGWVNLASLALLATVLYYAMLSWRLALGMVPVFVLIYALAEFSLRKLGSGVHIGLMIAIFVVAWIGQFIGHKIEGKKPSFFKDLQFLLIGPLWLLADVYRRMDVAIGGGTPVRS